MGTWSGKSRKSEVYEAIASLVKDTFCCEGHVRDHERSKKNSVMTRDDGGRHHRDRWPREIPGVGAKDVTET